MTRGIGIAVALLLGMALSAGCSGGAGPDGPSGSLELSLELGGGSEIDEIAYTISGNGMEPMPGTIDVSAPGATASVEVFGLPPGTGYLVTMTGTTTNGLFTCSGSTEFGVETGVATEVSVYLNCKRTPPLGGVRVNGKFNFCAQLSKVIVSPLQTSVGHDVDLSVAVWDEEGDDVDFLWAATGGLIEDPTAPLTRFICTASGSYTIFVSASDNVECIDEWSTNVTCVDGDGAPTCETDAECAGVFP